MIWSLQIYLITKITPIARTSCYGRIIYLLFLESFEPFLYLKKFKTAGTIDPTALINSRIMVKI